MIIKSCKYFCDVVNVNDAAIRLHDMCANTVKLDLSENARNGVQYIAYIAKKKSPALLIFRDLFTT